MSPNPEANEPVVEENEVLVVGLQHPEDLFLDTTNVAERYAGPVGHGPANRPGGAISIPPSRQPTSGRVDWL